MSVDIKKEMAKHVEATIAWVISLALSSLFMFCSPLHPWIGAGSSTDSSVFKTVALMMQKGYMPYRDSFDHKGPFIYLLNYMGNKISYYRGIWIIEVIMLAITIYWLYRIARLSCNVLSSAVSVFLALSLLFKYFEGGNLTEEYAMPCIAYSIFVFLDYLRNSIISRMRLVLAGVGLGIVLMLRPNMIALWFVFCIYVLVKLLCQKEYKELGYIVGFFALGVGIIVLPILLWLGLNNALGYFWDDYIVFNNTYSAVDSEQSMFPARWSIFMCFANTTVFVASIVSMLFFIKDKKTRGVNACYLVFVLVNVAFASVSGKQFGHYAMVLVPSVVYPFSLFFGVLDSVEQKTIRKSLIMVVSLYLFSSLIIPDWNNIIAGIPGMYNARHENEIDSDWDMNCILHIINEYTDPDQTISVYGNYDLVYVLSKRKHATRYSYQYPIGSVKVELIEEYYAQLQEELPVAIVVTENMRDMYMCGFLDKNDYDLVWSDDPEDDQSMAVFIRQG